MRILVQLTALTLAAGLGFHFAIASNEATSDAKHRQHEAFRKYKIALAERLSTDSQPRRRMAAAILTKVEAQLAAASLAKPGSDNFQSARFPVSLDPDELVSSALSQAPDDPLLLWIAATNCPASASACEPERSLDHLRELQPDNAMVWLQGSAIEHPEKRQAETITTTANDDDEDTRLRNIARASRVDGFHWGIRRLLLDAFLQRPLPDELLEASDFATPTQEKMAVIAAIGYEMAFVTPHYGLATKLCGGDAIHDDGDSRRELCIAALDNIARRADTMMMEQLALSRLLPLLPEGEERDAVEAKQRRSRWQQLAYAELLIPRSGRFNEMDAEAERQIAQLQQDDTTELAAMREALTEAGISLEPPRGWISPYDDPVVH